MGGCLQSRSPLSVAGLFSLFATGGIVPHLVRDTPPPGKQNFSASSPCTTWRNAGSGRSDRQIIRHLHPSTPILYFRFILFRCRCRKPLACHIDPQILKQNYPSRGSLVHLSICFYFMTLSQRPRIFNAYLLNHEDCLCGECHTYTRY